MKLLILISITVILIGLVLLILVSLINDEKELFKELQEEAEEDEKYD